MPRKRSDTSTLLARATVVADAIHEKDRQVTDREEFAKALDKTQRTAIHLNRIRPREADTRPLRSQHVTALAESIAALGLIEPLVVDLKDVLLAGGHRLAAIHKLKTTNPDAYYKHFPQELVPVRVMSINAESDPETSLQIELAENEKRINYSRDQIERLAERLRSLNYKDTPGRPKQGEKALGPALAVAIGVSERYVRKVLSGQLENRNSSTHSSNQEIRNLDPNFQKLKLLNQIAHALEKLAEFPEDADATRVERTLTQAIPTFLRKVEASIQERQALYR